eukprot:Phypoly_transcript_01329.p2 GENE.Phypoly_transcript_01329~~Phypoly_transcript_01329.p2  ORF type:complete len:408 (+),score=76.68 Phypoly_transcript_01329:1528-2751(+)
MIPTITTTTSTNTTMTTTTAITRPPLTPVSTPQSLLMNLVIHSDSESSSSFPSSSSSSSSEKASDDEELAEAGGGLGELFYSGEFVENCNFDSDSDSDYFRDIHIVTEEELIRRRRDKIRKLLKLYKAQFKRLKDKLRKRHFRYLKGKITSNNSSDAPNKVTGSSLTNSKLTKGGEYDGSSSESENTHHNRPTRHCNASNCSSKRVPPTIYCFSHILMDQNQKLFKGCTYTAPGVVCMNPILTTQSPPFCLSHIETASTAEKHVDKKRKELEPTVENSSSTRKIAKSEKDSTPSPQQQKHSTPSLLLSHSPVPLPLSVPIVPVAAHPTSSLTQTAPSSSAHPPHLSPPPPSHLPPHLSPHPPSHPTILPTARLAETFSTQTQILLGQIQEKEKSGSTHHVDSKNSFS